jgi:hypothetical protein
MAVTPFPSKLAYSSSLTMCLSLSSTATFKLSYAPWHTSQFLSQAQATTFNGFMEGQLGADPTYGTCFQCAAIDRARLKTNPVTPRSDVCSNCFKKYCYNPDSPPPEGQIVGRRFKHKDPDPLGIRSFVMKHKAYVITGAVLVGLGLIATITGCAMFWRKRFQRRKVLRSAAHQRLATGDSSESAGFLHWQGYEMEESHYTESHYAEPLYAEPLYAEPHYAEPHYAELHYADPHDTMTGLHDIEPSDVTTKTQDSKVPY